MVINVKSLFTECLSDKSQEICTPEILPLLEITSGYADFADSVDYQYSNENA